jgi:tetrahydromethanopterin S-methyltransferase subunit G
MSETRENERRWLFMSEEAKKETVEFPYRVASPEFFFLLQRIDRLDEKLSARIDQVNTRIDQVETKLSARIDQVETKLSARIDQVEGKLKPLFWTTIGIVLASLALTISVAVKIWR